MSLCLGCTDSMCACLLSLSLEYGSTRRLSTVFGSQVTVSPGRDLHPRDLTSSAIFSPIPLQCPPTHSLSPPPTDPLSFTPASLSANTSFRVPIPIAGSLSNHIASQMTREAMERDLVWVFR